MWIFICSHIIIQLIYDTQLHWLMYTLQYSDLISLWRMYADYVANNTTNNANFVHQVAYRMIEIHLDR